MTGKLHFRILLNCILVVQSDTNILWLEIIFSNVIKSKEFKYPSVIFLSYLNDVFYDKI